MAIAQRTPLFDRNPQYGWYDYGNFEKHPANIWFVGNCATGSTARADAAGFGMSPDSPFLTIAYALTQCTNSTGDVIYCLPGHVEAVLATDLTLNVIGVTIIGIGEGSYQPIISLDAEGSTIAVSAASVTIEHMHIVANFADVSVAITVAASDFTLRNCRCTGDGAGLNAEIWVQDGALLTTHRITVEDCIFIDNDAANDECLAFGGTGAEHVVRRNNFIGTWGTACISVTGACTYMLIADNNVYNIQALVVDTGINAATATGICVNNRASTGNASVNQITAPAMVKCQNYGGLIGDANGPLDPIAT